MDKPEKRLKIAVLVRRFVTTGGMERYCVEVTRRLAREHDVHVFAQEWAYEFPEPITFHKVPRYIVKPNYINQLFFSYYTSKKVDDSFDIIHSHERVTRFDILTVHCPCFRTYIAEEKNIFKKALIWLSIITSPRNTAYVWHEKLQFAFYEKRKLIAVSEKVKKNVQYCYPLPDEYFGIAFPGVDPDLMRGNDRKDVSVAFRKQHNISQDDLFILFVGTDFERKGLESLLKGFKLVTKPGIRLLIAGGGEKHQKYYNMVEDLGLSGSVNFLGLVSDMGSVYSASDIFILPTLNEPAGMAPVEAMAAGLPVIISSSEYAGCAEQIKDHEAVFIDDPCSPVEIADSLRSLFNEERRKELGKRGQKLSEKLTWEKTVEDTLSVYQEIIRLKR
jgi:UDP-glucose:(heptosyl)LPS alpha-1,3-glucosyltransferase